jgi:ribosomal protein L30/L7E
MIAIIRIAGQVNQNEEIKNTLDRLKLMRKLTCTFVDEKDKSLMGMVHFVSNKVAYGEVDKKLMDLTIEKRGQKDVKGKYRGFCRLHPPIGGFKKSTQLNYPKGVLGKNKEISKLLERML